MNTNFYPVPFSMPVIKEPVFPDHLVNTADFDSVQEAVNHCSALGGGTVLVPPGTWNCASIHLSSNIRLHLSEDSILSFSDQPADYLPPVFTRWEGMECYNYSPLIYAYGAQNIAVTGNGVLKGNGANWHSWKQLQQHAADELCYAEFHNIPPKDRIYGTPKSALRPSFLQFMECQDCLIEGVTFLDGPQWTIHPVYCENMIIRDVKVHTDGPNTDGLNPDSCKNMEISHCEFKTGDDCIAVNSGMNEDGWRVNRPSENIYIHDCKMTGGHGGVVIGSAVSGSVKNICAADCSISGTMQGIRLKSMRGRGGTVENIYFDNFQIDHVENEAIQITMFYEFTTVIPKSNTPSVFQNISIRNIKGQGAAHAITIKGLPEQKLKHIVLENIHLEADAAMTCSDVTDLKMKNIKLSGNYSLLVC